VRSLKKLSGISQKSNVGRIIDANLNRVKEGLRVCEEVTRFILDDHKFTAQLKALRHKINTLGEKIFPAAGLLSRRRVQEDVGRLNCRGELARGNCKDIYRANLQRVKESLRVLEEFSKLTDARAALNFKRLRYKAYEIEKGSFKKISTIPDPG